MRDLCFDHTKLDLRDLYEFIKYANDKGIKLNTLPVRLAGCMKDLNHQSWSPKAAFIYVSKEDGLRAVETAQTAYLLQSDMGKSKGETKLMQLKRCIDSILKDTNDGPFFFDYSDLSVPDLREFLVLAAKKGVIIEELPESLRDYYSEEGFEFYDFPYMEVSDDGQLQMVSRPDEPYMKHWDYISDANLTELSAALDNMIPYKPQEDTDDMEELVEYEPFYFRYEDLSGSDLRKALHAIERSGVKLEEGDFDAMINSHPFIMVDTLVMPAPLAFTCSGPCKDAHYMSNATLNDILDWIGQPSEDDGIETVYRVGGRVFDTKQDAFEWSLMSQLDNVLNEDQREAVLKWAKENKHKLSEL